MPVNTPTTKSSGPASSSKPMNVWMIVSAVLAIALVVAIVSAKGGSGDSDFQPISSDKAGNILIEFVNEIYAGQIGASTLKSVTEKNGMYEIIVTVDNNGQAVDQTVFVSRDGKLFIPQALDMADVRSQYQEFLNSGQVAPGGAGAVVPVPAGTPVVEDGDDPEIIDPEDTSGDE